ncbi:ribosome-associated protein [Glaciecola sp. MH2013]|uniref:ribosome biogenesis factor YjgA n=1 Tax=Glaciecola sp. MH2013 TaxID=2785524 RepID=UPI0018A0E8E4|nr:ribosome biogenesis factor YjgA [Glaciecola sp. MH2013]MBF7074204.1 ribosome-associated protein [Glaciecola sp. MH2013]
MNTDDANEVLLDENGEPIKSKTQLKQEAEVLKKLGSVLVDLSPGQLSEIPIDEELRDAISLANRINKKKDGFRRQLQLIGKILRQREIEPIEDAINRLRAHHLQSNQHFHLLEKHRDDIVEKGDSAIQSLLSEYPNLDRQKLRQLHRQAVKQKEAEKPPKASREIFQYLKQNIEE